MDRANAKEEGRRLAAERKRRAKEELEVSSTIARLDAIFEKLLHVGGLECEGVFRISPQEGVVPKLLKKVLATNRTDRLVRILKDLTEPHTVASLFKAVLGSRDVPLIPFELNPEWDQLAALSLGGPGRATESLAVAVLDFVVRVPEPHQQLLRRLIQMLQQVDRSSSEPTGSRMGAAALGVVFAPMVRRRDTFHDAGTDIGQQTKADAAALGSVISLLGDPLASLESVAKDPDWVAKAVAADEELARQHLSYGPTDRQQHDALPFEDSNAAVERWNAAEREAAWAAKHIEADLVDVSRRSSSSLATNEAELLWSSRNSSPNHQHPGADVSNVQSDQTTQQSQPRQSTHQLLLAASEAAGRHYGLSPGAALVAQRSTIEHATTRVQQLQQVLIQSTELTKQRLELRWRLQNAALDRDHAAQGLQSVDLDLTRAATAGADHQRWLRELQNTVSNRRRAASSKAADVRRLQEANAALLEDLRALATQDPTDLEEFQKRELKALQEERDAVYIELNRQKESRARAHLRALTAKHADLTELQQLVSAELDAQRKRNTQLKQALKMLSSDLNQELRSRQQWGSRQSQSQQDPQLAHHLQHQQQRQYHQFVEHRQRLESFPYDDAHTERPRPVSSRQDAAKVPYHLQHYQQQIHRDPGQSTQVLGPGVHSHGSYHQEHGSQ